MVMDYGMSPLGPMQFSPQYESGDYKRAFAEPQKVSEGLQEKIDAEVKNLVDTALKKATALLKKHRSKLDKVSQKLLEVETLDGDEFKALL